MHHASCNTNLADLKNSTKNDNICYRVIVLLMSICSGINPCSSMDHYAYSLMEFHAYSFEISQLSISLNLSLTYLTEEKRSALPLFAAQTAFCSVLLHAFTASSTADATWRMSQEPSPTHDERSRK